MKILDGGSDEGRLNLVLVAEGYRASDERLFEEHAERLARFISREAWYRVGMLNVHRLFVESKEPAYWVQVGGESGDTAFKVRWGAHGSVSRLLSGEDDLVSERVQEDGELYALVHWGVLVNSRRRGGKGGPRGVGFWTTTEEGFEPRALHEFGHSFAGLGDEYQYNRGLVWPSDRDEPRYPNVTADPTGQKWDHLTSEVYEGAGRYDKGLYRPAKGCRMRSSSAPFCAVCTDSLVRSLEELLDELPEPVEQPVVPDPPIERFDVTGSPGIISVQTAMEVRVFEDSSAGAMEAVQYILRRQFLKSGSP